MPGNPGNNLDGTPVNRYLDLVDALPAGEFYGGSGIRIPYQGTKPYDLVVQTSEPNRVFGIFVNGAFRGTVTTDSNSVARLSLTLDLGRNDVTLEDDVTGRRTRTFLDAYVMHVAHAALAQVVEDIDENIQDTLNDRRLEASERNQIEDVWGKRLLHPNSPAYQHEAYREQLQEVHQGYRMFGGRQQGLEDVVATVTTVTPWRRPFRSFGPRWALGNSFVGNAQFQDRNRQQFTRASDIPGVTSIDAVGSHNQLGVGTLTYAWPAQTLTWTPPGGVPGPAVAVAAGGAFVLHGTHLPARFIARINGPYAIVAGVNDRLRLNIDGRGSITITLTPGGAQTALAVAADINAALLADVRYGVGYGFVATVLVTQRVQLVTPGATAGSTASIVLENVTQDAYTTVFGFPWVRSTFLLGEVPGSTLLDLVVSDPFPDANPATGTYSVWLARNTVREEMIEITANNRALDQLTAVVPGLALVKLVGDTVELQGAFPYETRGLDNLGEGITVTVDSALLPVVGDTETVTLLGSDVPDGWLGDNISTASYLPSTVFGSTGFFNERQFYVTNDGTGDTTLETEADERVWQYREWPFTLSAWLRNYAAVPINVRLGVNFGAGWVESGLFAVPSDNADGGMAPTFVSYDTILPEGAGRFGVRIRHDGAAVGQMVELLRASLRQPNVTALSLGINTVPRSEHRAYFAELIYIWSPVDLTAAENGLLGLPFLTTTPKGHVDNVLPAHVEGDRFDISEYAGVVPQNIRGVFTEAELFTGVSTNLQLTVRTPARRSYLRPTRISQVTGEVLAFPSPPVPPFLATLAVTSDQDQTAAQLYEDGIVVPNDRWIFTSATQVQVTVGYNSGARYTIDYQALIQYESPVIDLTASFADYVWYVDYHVWTRFEPELQTIQRIVQVLFDPQTRRASLRDRSDRDKSATVLTENDGLAVRTVPSRGYRYLDPKTILINSDQLKTNAVYFVSYMALRSSPVRVPTITLMRRRAATPVLLAAAPWVVTTKDAVLPASGRYLQYRVSVGSIMDLRDLRLFSVSAKGLPLLNPTSIIPVLQP